VVNIAAFKISSIHKMHEAFVLHVGHVAFLTLEEESTSEWARTPMMRIKGYLEPASRTHIHRVGVCCERI
jgi:hypothetical protein